MNAAVTRWLARAPDAVFSAWAIVAAFSCYFAMYAYRKPFAAGSFEGVVELPWLGELDYKILLILSQVMGYALSKFMGIKIISEMTAPKRAAAILLTIGTAWAALGLFAITPAPWGAVFLFVNGVPLGMVWGLVFGFLEGRRSSELLGAGLSGSYIVASGFVKSAGLMTLGWGVSEQSMPFVTGALFLPLTLVSVWMLAVLPPPNEADIALRTERKPMDAEARADFLRRFGPGVVLLAGLYVLLTAYRDFRDNFARELWGALGYDGSPEILTTSELPITVAVLVALGALMTVKDNRRALLIVHGLMLSGTVLIGVSTLLWEAGILAPAPWMILVGLGLYIGYVPYGCVLFDRLIAAVGYPGNAGFMIYLADSFGYLGSVALLLYKNFGQGELSWLEFFARFSYLCAVVCSAAFVSSALYFWRKLGSRDEPAAPTTT
ncbi:DUF5690 family protein [Myxococcota bacterium]|nr:DUF5690 family protein [Myxococcota bacterium]